MAVTTTARRLLATGAIAGTALLALAIPASAHTPHVTAKCDNGKTTLHVNLEAYNGQKANTVKATDGDSTLVDTTFKSNYDKSWDVSADQPHTFTVTVAAWDDPNGKQGFSFTQTLTVEACVVPTTTPPPSTTTGTVAPTTTNQAPVPPSTTPAPPAAQGGLPNTGASVGLPLVLGAVLLVGGGALLLVVRRRRSQA